MKQEREFTPRLREEAMEWLHTTASHLDCEDCWYSCALLCCDDRRKSDKCDCGAEQENAWKQDILAALSEKPTPMHALNRWRDIWADCIPERALVALDDILK